MILSVAITLIIMNFINVLLHGIGIFLLFCIYNKGKKRREQNVQNIFIMNLSICELLMNGLEMVRTSLKFLIEYNVVKSYFFTVVEIYLAIFMYTGISIIFYLGMFYITLDRLVNIVLGIQYRRLCTERKAKLLLAITWLIGGLTAISISIIHNFITLSWEALIYKFIYPLLEFTFIILAVVTYISIFNKYTSSERVMSQRRKDILANKTPASRFKLFRKSRFFIAVLLIFSFILFMVVPDLILLFVGVIKGKMSDLLMSSCWLSYAVSNMVDALIYIFMQRSVRELLLEKYKHVVEVLTFKERCECIKKSEGEKHFRLTVDSCDEPFIQTNVDCR